MTIIENLGLSAIFALAIVVVAVVYDTVAEAFEVPIYIPVEKESR